MARIAFLLAVALVFTWSVVAGANMAKWWRDGEGHGPLVPRNDADIRVDAEDLVFDVAPSLDHAAVTASYRMTHAGVAPTTAEVAFVVVDDESPSHREGPPKATITIDGAPVTYRVLDVTDVLEPMLEASSAAGAFCPGDCMSFRGWARTKHSSEPSEVRLHRDETLPAAREVLPEEVTKLYAGWSKGAPDRPLHWLLFEIPFASGASRTVTVAYDHIAGSDSHRSVNDVFVYDYLLSPASRWTSFGSLHLTVHTPSKTKLLSSLPLARTDGPSGATYETKLPKLPAGELSLELMSLDHVLFGMTHPAGYWLLLLAAMLAVTLPIARTLGRRLGPATYGWSLVGGFFLGGPLVLLATSGLVALVSFLSPQHAFGFGYGASFGILFAIAFFTAVGIAVCAKAARRGRRPG